jgi:hypothetical protein
MSAGKRVAIVQSNYVPWRGYFDLIASVDEFILLDDAQYTRRDWRNRNKIKTPQGPRWLTIAVQVSGRYTQSISETLVAEPDWADRHWDMLRQLYARVPRFGQLGGFVESLYASVPGPGLTQVNRHFLEGIAARLGIGTPITLSADYTPQGAKTDRLLDLCVKAEASEYVSGPAARAYLEEDKFRDREIAVSWFEYGPYAKYDQPYPPFDPQMSILDLLLCAGEESASLVRRVGNER